MRKRKRIVLLVLIIAILIGGVCMIIIQNKTPNVKAFEFNDYQYYIDNFPSEENVGNIIDAKDERQGTVLCLDGNLEDRGRFSVL